MASVINTNNASLVAQRNLSNSQNALTTSVQRLSSGLRINSAKDDAAGLGISEKLQSQTTSTNVAIRNANDAISMVQTAEGGLQEVATMLQRMRELAVQGANDSLSTTQMNYIGTEVNNLRDEINKVSLRTTFNGKDLLNGDQSAADSLVFQTGEAETDTMDISALMINTQITTTNGTTYTNEDETIIQDATGAVSAMGTIMTALGTAIDTVAGSEASGDNGPTSVTPTSANYGALGTAVDSAIGAIASARSSLGATQNRLDHNIANLQSTTEALTASRSRIMDTDYSTETATLTKNQVMQQAATAMLAQANQMPNVVLSLLK